MNRFTRSSDISAFQKKVIINVREKKNFIAENWNAYRNFYLARHYAPLERVTAGLIST